MLRRTDIPKYTGLAGADGAKLNAYFDGYEKGLKTLYAIKLEIESEGAYRQEVGCKEGFIDGINYCLDVIERYLSEVSNNE